MPRHPPDPTPDQLAALPAHMHRWFRVADFVNRHLKFLSAAWIHTTMRGVLWLTAGNRMKVHGTEHVEDLDKSSRVLMVANHRSFFDFYVVAFANVRHTRLAQRAFFPVRAKFFYEGLVGTVLNWWMTIIAMFPPIVRDPKRRAWNRYALKRIEAELTIPGTWVGIHPEGRRNKSSDPYSFLKPYAGTGKIALAVGDVRVIPLYVVGITSNLLQETKYNWWRPEEHRIDVYYGPPVDLSDLREGLEEGEEPTREQAIAASRRCMEAIVALAEKHREEYNPDAPPVELPEDGPPPSESAPPPEPLPLSKKARPYYGMAVRDWAAYRLAWWATSLLDAGWWRIKARGQEWLPKDGGYLLLPNHASGFDPWIVAIALWRPLAFMASAQYFKSPYIGAMLKKVGAFPKVKYVKDTASMKHMTELYENGQAIAIFPEGRQSWDGHLLKLMPGIGRTIKRMEATVVLCRMPANTFLQPRWAKYPRWVPLDCEYIGPINYEDLSEEEITADIEQRLQITPTIRSGARTFMFRPAVGLPNYLWACPRCKKIGAITATGWKRDHISCTACQTSWRLDVECNLHPTDGGGTISVREAAQQIDAHFGVRPVMDQAQFDSDGVALSEPSARVYDVASDGGDRIVGEGRLQLTEQRLAMLGANGQGETWGVDIADLVSVSIERGRPQLRTADAVHQIEVPATSVVKLGHFIKRWRFPDDPEPVG